MRPLPALAVLAAVLLGVPAWAQRIAEKPPALVPAWAAKKLSQTDPDTGDPPVTEMHQWHIHGGVAYEGDWASGWHLGVRLFANWR
jgi:hypothetical protein